MKRLTDGEREILAEQNRDAADAERAMADAADPADLEGVPVAVLDWWHVGWADAYDGKPQTPPDHPDAAREYDAGYRECRVWVKPRPAPQTDTPTVIPFDDDFPF